MELIYKKIEEKDKEKLFKLIDIVLNGLPDQAHFIPYEQWELDSMFDDVNYAPLYGAYDGEKLVGMAQLYVPQDMLKDFKEEFDLTEYKVCELGGNLVLPEYRGRGITTKLQTIEMQLAKDLGFDYIISMAHPDNIGSCNTLERIGSVALAPPATLLTDASAFDNFSPVTSISIFILSYIYLGG